MFKTLGIAAVALSLVACAGMTKPGASSMKLEDVKAKGRKLTAEETTALVLGAKIEGRALDSGAAYTLTPTADGKFTGRSDRGTFAGTWNMNAQGQTCFYTQPTPSSEPCADHYMIGDKIYAVTPSGHVLDRRITR